MGCERRGSCRIETATQLVFVFPLRLPGFPKFELFPNKIAETVSDL